MEARLATRSEICGYWKSIRGFHVKFGQASMFHEISKNMPTKFKQIDSNRASMGSHLVGRNILFYEMYTFHLYITNTRLLCWRTIQCSRSRNNYTNWCSTNANATQHSSCETVWHQLNNVWGYVGWLLLTLWDVRWIYLWSKHWSKFRVVDSFLDCL